MTNMLKTVFIGALLMAAPITLSADDAKDSGKKTLPVPEAQRFITSHSGTFGGKKISYTAIVENHSLKNDKGEVYADAVTTSYIAKSKDRTRPVTFVFNGGPGSSSVWLHLGLMGPKRVVVPSDAKDAGNAPYTLVDNSHSPLDLTDIVMIDPIGTGYSTLAGVGKAEDVWGLKEDAKSVTHIIRRWIKKHNRWNAPKYIMGESFGTTRAAAMMPYLNGRAEPIRINGLMLVSQALDYTGSTPYVDNNLISYVTYLPTMAATAWYHDKLVNKPASLDAYMAEVRAFAMNDYLPALFKGSSLAPAAHKRLAGKIAGYLGITEDYVTKADLRVNPSRYVKELLRGEGKSIGRLDARYAGMEVDRLANYPSYDAGSAAIGGAFATALNDYLVNSLNVSWDRSYNISGPAVAKGWVWDRGLSGGGEPMFVNTAPDLAQGMAQNPALRVWVASGYLDYATPFFDAEYTFWRHGIDMERVKMTYYPAGHMMYIHRPSLDAVVNDMRDFLNGK